MDGATNDAIEGVDVEAKAALAATAVDVLDADGYVLGTPANLGYISGALKHFFDQIYYPCLDDTAGRRVRLLSARQQRRDRRGPSDRDDHDWPAVEARPEAGDRDRRADQGRPGRLLGAGRGDGGRSGTALTPSRHGLCRVTT